MDARQFDEAVRYEALVSSIYQAILDKQAPGTVSVQHNVSLPGKSGACHQIDVCWQHTQAGITHRVLIECKNYSSNVSLEKVRSFYSVLQDIGNCSGVMVTRTGYQAGAAEYCRHHGIALKLLRQPLDADWDGRVATVHIRMQLKTIATDPDKPLNCVTALRPTSAEQEGRIRSAANWLEGKNFASACFVSPQGDPITDELKWWLPRNIDVLKYEDGGPYEEIIPLESHCLSLDLGAGEELIEVPFLKVGFYVESVSEDVVADARETVTSILKDFDSGEWEHIKRG